MKSMKKSRLFGLLFFICRVLRRLAVPLSRLAGARAKYLHRSGHANLRRNRSAGSAISKRTANHRLPELLHGLVGRLAVLLLVSVEDSLGNLLVAIGLALRI